MLTQESLSKLFRSLILHEEFKNFPYTDSKGKITIGIGYNLTDRGMDDEWINTQCKKDILYFYHQLTEHFGWFQRLNPDRQIVLVDMCFMGFKRFLEFDQMIDALSKDDYFRASEEMLNSDWAKETKGRAIVLAQAMKSGNYDI
jgi:lysozyme